MKPGNGLRPVNKVGVCVGREREGGVEGRKEIPRVQCHLTRSDLSLQAAIGLLSYLEMGVCVWSVGFQREDRCVCVCVCV